jgi:hypothetical protein
VPAVSRNLFDDLVPQHSGISTSLFERFLDLAAKKLDHKKWGKHYPEAAVYYAGHLLDLRERAKAAAGSTSKAGGSPGSLVSWSEDKQSVEFSDPADVADTLTDQILSSTVSGQQYLMLRNSIFGAPHVASGR